ncbi:hypothetical protein CGJ24_22135 [Vibrio parahaemolyticus]|nr:hypothetical protein CGJ24_22135 [Vibrio parahaemolyticus]
MLWVKFSVYGVHVECCGSVVHTLIGRYALVEMEIIHHERFSEFITKYWPKSQNQKWKNCS